MKKSLLFAAMASLVGTSFAYDTVDGLTLTKQWEYTRVADQWIAGNVNSLETSNSSRMAAVTDKYVVVPERDTDNNVFIHLFDKNTGAWLKKIAATLDGVQFSQGMGANVIGTDDYGHVWISNLVLHHNLATDARTLHYFTDLEKGELAVAAPNGLVVDVDEEGLDEDTEAKLRYDYCDVAGDVSREKSACVVISASSTGADAAGVLGWRCEQGEQEWGPHMKNGKYCFVPITQLSQSKTGTLKQFGLTTTTRIVRDADPDQLGQLFYVDGSNTPPALYDSTGKLIDGFDFEKDINVIPSGSQSGIAEFYLGEQLYFVLAATVNNPGAGTAQLDVFKAPEGTIAGSTQMWRFPEEGCGDNKQAGCFNHPIFAEVVKDENGVEGCYVTHYLVRNALGRYLIAPEGFKAGVNDVIADEDANAPVEYYNLQGVRVNNPAAGQLVIKKQGKTATKVFAL